MSQTPNNRSRNASDSSSVQIDLDNDEEMEILDEDEIDELLRPVGREEEEEDKESGPLIRANVRSPTEEAIKGVGRLVRDLSRLVRRNHDETMLKLDSMAARLDKLEADQGVVSSGIKVVVTEDAEGSGSRRSYRAEGAIPRVNRDRTGIRKRRDSPSPNRRRTSPRRGTSSSSTRDFLPCLFCDMRTHAPTNCGKYSTVESRLARLEETNRCDKCMLHPKDQRCRRTDLQCPFCYGAHTGALCPNS